MRTGQLLPELSGMVTLPLRQPERRFIPLLGLVFLCGCAGGNRVAVRPTDTQPAAGVEQQSGGVNLNADTQVQVDAALARIGELETQLQAQVSLRAALESQVGALNAKLTNQGTVNVTGFTSYGGGGALGGLLLYWLVRYLGLRPPTPAERQARRDPAGTARAPALTPAAQRYLAQLHPTTTAPRPGATEA